MTSGTPQRAGVGIAFTSNENQLTPTNLNLGLSVTSHKGVEVINQN